MRFDTFCGDRPRALPTDPPPETAAVPPEAVLGYWEEHCTECGQPDCFRRCPHYERAADGKCRRFEEGIRPVTLRGGTPAWRIAFRPWGKLEMPWRGVAATPARLRFLRVFDALAVPVARGLRRLLPWMPWHRNPISFARAFRTRFLRWAGAPHTVPDRWRLTLHADAPTVLLCTVSRGGAECFCHRLTLTPGWNRADIVLPPQPPVPGEDLLFRIFPPTGGTGPLLFAECLLYRSGEGAPVPAPAAPAPVSSAASPAAASAAPASAAASPAAPAPFVKCLIWDLDNTLWQGILTEDGPDGIRLRPEALDVLHTLDRRGILHSVASKNDPETVLPVLNRLGLGDLFLAPQIGWGPKSAAVDRIAAALGLGSDSFAFVDDAVYEREEVRAAHPEVRIFSETDLGTLCSRPCFSPPVSAESAARRRSYLAEARRTADAAAYDGDAEAFLRSCGLQLTLQRLPADIPPDAPTALRCLELTERTHRLTLAGHRYTPDAFRTLLKENDVYAVTAADRYGDYGTVGCLAVRPGPAAAVRELVLSCRVAKKRCEESLLLAVADRLRADGSTVCTVDAVPTGRNTFLFEALDASPFVRTPLADGTVRYTLRLADPVPAVFRHPVRWLP